MCRDCLERGEAPYASHLFYAQEGREIEYRELGFIPEVKADLKASQPKAASSSAPKP